MSPELRIEKFFLAKALVATGAGNDEDALEKIRPAVQRLSDLFTTERPAGGFPDYAADPSLLAAYGLFFFPQSFCRAGIALDQAVRFRHWKPGATAGELKILDLGSGTGPCGLAHAFALRALAPETPIRLTALDHAPAALSALRALAPQVGLEKFSVETHAVDLRRADAVLKNLPRQDIIVAGFSANELFGSNAGALRDWADSLCEKLTPGGLLLILEPALRETATTLQRAADALVAGGRRHRFAPELDNAPCPLLAEKTGKFWSHEVREWTPPASLEFLNRKLFRDIGVLKFAYAALSPTPPAPLPERPAALRLISPVEALKGRFVFSAVIAGGKKITVDIPSRGLSKSETKAVCAAWERGDIAGAETLQPLGREGFFRIAGIEDLRPLYRLKQNRG